MIDRPHNRASAKAGGNLLLPPKRRQLKTTWKCETQLSHFTRDLSIETTVSRVNGDPFRTCPPLKRP